MSRETITLDNFADYHGTVNGVEIASDLSLEPYLPSDGIGIHLGRVARAARFAHLDSVNFTRYHKPEDEIYPDIAGMDDHVTAVASFSASASRAARIDSLMRLPDLAEAWLLNKGDVSIGINFGHADLKEIELREAKPWARYLNTAISEGLRWSANYKLMQRSLKGRLGFMGATLALPMEVLALQGPESALIVYGGASAMYSPFLKAGARFLNNVAQNRSYPIRFSPEYSLIPGVPLDRLAISHAYIRTRKFAQTK